MSNDADRWLEELGRNRVRAERGLEPENGPDQTELLRRLTGHLKTELESLQRQVDTIAAEVRARESALRLSTVETRLKTAETTLAGLDGLRESVAADLAEGFRKGEKAALERERAARKADAERIEEGLEAQREELRKTQARLAAETASMASRVDEVERLVGDTAARMARLEPRLDWLERTGRIRSGAHEVDLDRLDDPVLSLREAVRTGRRAEEALLTPAQRDAEQAEVARHEQACATVRARTEAAMAAAGRLAAGRGGERHAPRGEYRRALQGYEQARAELRRAEQAERELRDGAEAARERLAADERARSTTRADRDAATAARDRLLAEARTRIAEGCQAGAVPPLWFWETFVPGPRTRPSGSWEELAAEVLVHRWVWGVRDASPLGAEPQTPPTRRGEYLALRSRLAALDTPAGGVVAGAVVRGGVPAVRGGGAAGALTSGPGGGPAAGAVTAPGAVAASPAAQQLPGARSGGED